MQDRELRRILAEARAMERQQPVLTLLHLLLPVALMVGTVLFLRATGRLGTVGPAALTAFFTVGKLLILAGSVPKKIGMTTTELALMVFCMDVFVGYAFAFNMHHLYKVGRFGAWLERLTNFCRWWLKQQPWMKKWAFTAVMLFVMFPLTGTGAPGGSLLGRLVGLRPFPTLFAITLGSALGVTLIAGFATPLEPLFREIEGEWWFDCIGLAVLAIVGIALWRLGRRLSRAADDFARAEATGGDR